MFSLYGVCQGWSSQGMGFIISVRVCLCTCAPLDSYVIYSSTPWLTPWTTMQSNESRLHKRHTSTSSMQCDHGVPFPRRLRRWSNWPMSTLRSSRMGLTWHQYLYKHVNTQDDVAVLLMSSDRSTQEISSDFLSYLGCPAVTVGWIMCGRWTGKDIVRQLDLQGVIILVTRRRPLARVGVSVKYEHGQWVCLIDVTYLVDLNAPQSVVVVTTRNSWYVNFWMSYFTWFDFSVMD